MTELFRPLSFRADDPSDVPDAVGKPVPGVEIRLALDETASRDNIGELWIKSPAMMDCYLDAPDETNEVISNGWFKTGDLATISPQGYVQIVGRVRERILEADIPSFHRRSKPFCFPIRQSPRLPSWPFPTPIWVKKSRPSSA